MADITNTLMGAAVVGIGANMAMNSSQNFGSMRPRNRRKVRRNNNMMGGLVGTAVGLTIMGAGMNAMKQ